MRAAGPRQELKGPGRPLDGGLADPSTGRNATWGFSTQGPEWLQWLRQTKTHYRVQNQSTLLLVLGPMVTHALSPSGHSDRTFHVIRRLLQPLPFQSLSSPSLCSTGLEHRQLGCGLCSPPAPPPRAGGPALHQVGLKVAQISREY